MRANLTLLQGALVLLLAGSAIVFFVGSTIERHHRHHETAASVPAKASSGESGGETNGEGSKHAEPATGEAGVKLLGVNTESLALSIVAVVLSLLLAAVIVARVWARAILIATVVFGLVFLAGDARELVHQLDDANGGLAAVAALLIGLHLAIAAFAAALLVRELRGESPPLPAPAG